VQMDDAKPVVWGALHIFGPYFHLDVEKAIKDKFAKLSSEQKASVYANVYKLANPADPEPKWGETHVFDSVPLLADAMAAAEGSIST
jgi:hypothetical protein